MTVNGQTTISQNSSAPVAASADLAEDLVKLRELMTRPNLEDARVFVEELQQRWPESDRVRRLAGVLAPPVVRRVPGDEPRARDRRTELAWIAEHAGTHSGCWLALVGDQLIAVDPDLRVVVEKVHATPGAEHALLHFEPKSREVP